MIEKRNTSRFTEQLSTRVIFIAALGGFIVLLDPTVSGQVLGWQWKLGTGDFSAELKGAVVTIMLIGGWTAVVSFWIGASKQGDDQSKSIARIAEAAPAAAAAAVGTGNGTAIATESVQVQAETVSVTEQPPK